MKKNLSVIFAILLSFSSILFVSCKNNSAKNSNEYNTLFAFEDKSELENIMQKNFFGKYSLNYNIDYVKKGNASLQVEPCGEGYGDKNFQPKLWLYSNNGNGENLSNDKKLYYDFSSTKKILIDVYNTSDTSKKCYIRLGASSKGNIIETDLLTYELPSKTWFKCVYEINYEKLGYIYDFSKVEYISLEFDSLKINEPRTTYYIDNIIANETKEERKLIPIELEENEFLNFEKDYQRNLFYVTGYGAYWDYVPEISINKDKRYITSGENSLKLHIPHGTNNESCYVRILFCEKLMEIIDIASYGTTYEIVFDLYNNSDSAFHIESDLRSEKQTYARSFVPTPKTWVQCRLSLFEADMLTQKNDPSFLTQNLTFEITYGDFSGSSSSDDKDIYIDNIRFEKVN